MVGSPEILHSLAGAGIAAVAGAFKRADFAGGDAAFGGEAVAEVAAAVVEEFAASAARAVITGAIKGGGGGVAAVHFIPAVLDAFTRTRGAIAASWIGGSIQTVPIKKTTHIAMILVAGGTPAATFPSSTTTAWRAVGSTNAGIR